ncbi:MAG: Asp-tRNA(Asn)/Glu-tRNA(Gln) amidotransferase subunit GatA [Candidatus Taylorbacteria bacterium]|nr:Asp-tRNA(Asn)/Glu-tRNA(Gln) amidotransferase subunit GatA [Candidatus Taylorbacteria bacterium]
MIDLKSLTIEKAHTMLVSKEISVNELVSAYLEHAKSKNPELNAFIEFFDGSSSLGEGAREWDEGFEKQITHAQALIDAGNAHLLCGIPYGIKDNILYKGHIASAGSHMLENYTAAYSATVIEKLNTAGAICIGRTNMDDAAMGSSTESSYYGPTKNPIDPTRVPGGSSGGSATAVAADMCLFALGTDTGGSVRQPASFCGVVGMYPTYGSTSRHGAIAMGSSLDQIGPFGKNVRDAQIVFETISGYDTMDATSLTDEVRKQLSGNPLHASGEGGSAQQNRVRTVGVPRAFVEMEGISPEVKKNFEVSLEILKNAGYEIRDIELPNAHLGLAVYYIVMPAEVSSNLSRYDGMKYGFRDTGKDLLETYLKTRRGGFGVEPRRRILLGTYVLSAGYYDAYYNKALKVRELIKKDFEKVFESGVDVVLTPTTPTTAFTFGAKKDPLSMYLADIFTISANLTHMPAITIPSGSDTNGLPFGIQFTANQGQEETLFTITSDFEKNKK